MVCTQKDTLKAHERTGEKIENFGRIQRLRGRISWKNLRSGQQTDTAAAARVAQPR